MSASSIPAGRAGGYAEYLESKTVEPERGDYYLTPDGEMTEAPGQWLADRDTLEGLGVDPDRPVDHADFKALMEGRHPESGDWLRAAGAGGERGGGIDATFSAPKSVSVAWALSDAWQREGIEQAHAEAVEQAIQYMREHVSLVRARHGGEVMEEPAKDVIAAEFRHTTARGVDGAQAPDPQLHSHVVITGAIREDDRPVAVASRPVFRAAREVGAYYRSVLAQGLSEQGYEIEQNTGKDERYFEIAGVPEDLRDEFSGRSREVARAAERFRAEHGRAPENGELRNLALENRRSKTLTTRSDLQQAWQETGERHEFGPEDAMGLLTQPEQPTDERDSAERIMEKLTEHHAVFGARELRAVALEQTAGDLSPEEALNTAQQMIDDREILTLEDDKMTTLQVRAQEEAIERRAENLAQPAGRDVGDTARENAAGEAAERIGAPLGEEQQNALATITGPERAATLVGQAGTGKGVVIDAAARAEQRAGHQTIGVAVSGSTAERLGNDSPALEGQTMTLDALIARADAGSLDIGQGTTVFLDEAGMVDHDRLDALTELVEGTGAKLIAVGDGQQLPAIGPGGMFDRIAEHTPTAELHDIYRTQDTGEQEAWQALRDGNPGRALEYYQEQGLLHMEDTRDEAGEAAVQHWHALAQEHGIENVALIADASNQEIDRLNARAQHLRGQHGEIGQQGIQMESKHYGLHQGDRVAFATQHHPQDEPRVENGTRGEITHLDPDKHQATISIDGSDRTVTLAGKDLESLRLAYAEHIYRQQGATVDRSIVLTGGWQTSKESSYVEASRAREGTDWYLARDELGTHGQDKDRIERLSHEMSETRSQTPSLDYQELPNPADQLNPTNHHSPYLEHNHDPEHPDHTQEWAR
jgi:conjugative relaxase-like TrwC/TraI family protein